MANLGVKDAKNTVPASSVADGPLVRFGLTLSTWSERWFPDPLVFALAGVVLVFIFGVIIGQKPGDLAYQGGKAFWTLVPFTMQMVMIIIGGYVVATAPIVNRFIAWISTLPKNPRTAIAVVAFLSMLTSLISWGLSLIFSGLLVRELAKRVKGMDIRAAGAAGYLGLGAVWALGLSSSAAMMMATKSSIPAGLYQIAGVIPLKQTLFLWQGLATAALLIVLSTIIAYASAPGADKAKTAADFGIEYESSERKLEPRTRPGEWLEYSPLLSILVAGMLIWYLATFFKQSPTGALAALDLNNYNLIFITVGLLLHWRPKSFVKAVSECVPATGGVLIQFPFYAVIFGMIVGRSLRRQQVGDRSALCSAGREHLACSPWLGGTDLQRLRGAAQPHQPVLDAPPARLAPSESARPGRLRSFADDRARAGCLFPLLVLRSHHSLHRSGEVGKWTESRTAHQRRPFCLGPRTMYLLVNRWPAQVD